MPHYEDKVWEFFSDLPLEPAQCIFCKDRTKSVTKFNKHFLEINQCECGFVYLKTQPTPSQLEKFYENSEALETWAKIKTSPAEDLRQKNKYVRAINLIQEGEPIPQVLDLGCGNAVFLKLLRESMPKSICTGVDTNISASLVAEKSHSMIVRQDVYEYLKSGLSKFDWITMWGVLEHVKDPVGLLTLIKSRLTKTGRIIVCVPNINSLVCTLLGKDCFTFCPQHLWYFSIVSLKRLFHEYKLENFWTVESESGPIRRVTEGHKPYDKTKLIETPPKTSIFLANGEHYENLDQYIIDQNLGYKIVAVFSL